MQQALDTGSNRASADRSARVAAAGRLLQPRQTHNALDAVMKDICPSTPRLEQSRKNVYFVRLADRITCE